MPFLDTLDIGNRALQHCGAPQIGTVNEDSKSNKEVSFAYDKVRRAELRRNTWRFSIRRTALRAVDDDTMIIVPAAWSNSVTYLPGAIVADTNGLLWLSNTQDNLANEPGPTDAWDMYFGPMTVSLYDEDTTYFAGELVYEAGTNAGSYAVYLSLQNDNDDDPATSTAYDATVTYKHGDVVSYSGSQWRSLIELNLGITPALGPLAYDNTATYAIGNTVTGSDHFIYSSVGSGNTGHDPVTDAGVHWTNTTVANAWTNVPTLAVSSIKWRPINATITNLSFTYPIGAGPSTQSTSNNVFRLPAGYLRQFIQGPKAGSYSYLGGPSGRAYNDWEFQGNYLTSSCSDVLIFPFIADVTRVSDMDDLFCEGLACRIAAAVCQALTQSDSKLQTIASEYKLFMGEARTVNAIEVGPIEPPEDEYIAVRA